MSLAQNFHDDLLAGEWIPRMQPAGPVPDIAVFQYYGFLSSLFAQAGLFLGVSPWHSLLLGIILIRWLGSVGLYYTCRLQGLSRQAGVLAVIAWLAFPYIESNLYARYAISELFAQALLFLLPMSWALATRRGKTVTVFAVMMTVLLLGLAHAIFLLWAAVALAVMIIAAVLIKRRDAAQSLLVGLVLGICVSSFQWLPALLSSADLKASFLTVSPFARPDRWQLTSFSGFFGWPKPSVMYGTAYYLTGSLWVFPAMFFAFVYLLKRKDARADIWLDLFFLTTSIFIVYSPWDFWKFLPKVFWATEFTYRFLSFVAIFGAVILAYASDALGMAGRWGLMVLAAAAVLLCSGTSLILPKTFPLLEQHPDQEDIKSRYALQIAGGFMTTNNSDILWDEGWLKRINRINVPPMSSDIYLYLEGWSGVPSGRGVALKVIDAQTQEDLLTQDLYVPPAGFMTRIPVRHGVASISLVPDHFFKLSDIDPRSIDSRDLSVWVSAIYFVSNGISPLISSQIERRVIAPYQRSFSFPQPNGAGQDGHYIINLPLAYSRFEQITQAGSVLKSYPVPSGLTLVETNGLKDPVISCYKLPALVYFFTAAGIAAFIFYLWFNRRRKELRQRLY